MEPLFSDEDYMDYSDYLLEHREELRICNGHDLIDHMEKKTLWEEYLATKGRRE